MKKKFVRIICWTIAIALLCTAVWFLCAFFGNPISSALAKSTAKRYLEDNYPDADFIIAERVVLRLYSWLFVYRILFAAVIGAPKHPMT